VIRNNNDNDNNNNTLAALLERQVQQQRWQLLAKRRSMLTFVPVTSLMPVAVETLGVFNASARHLLDDLGRRISLNSGEARETSYLYQWIVVLVQQ